MSSIRDPRSVLEFAAAQLGPILNAERGALILRTEGARLLAFLDDVGAVRLSIDEPGSGHRAAITVESGEPEEILTVLENDRPILLEELSAGKLASDILALPLPTPGCQVMLHPLHAHKRTVGVLVAMRGPGQAFSPLDATRGEAMAAAISFALGIEPVKQVAEGQRALEQAEHGLEEERFVELSRYLDFFESSRDAMLVMDRGGKILFANPVAAQLTERGAGSLPGVRFPALFSQDSQLAAQDIVEGFSLGKYPLGVDLHLGSGRPRVVNVNFSGMMRETNAVLAALRDVTPQRELARELAKMRDFLGRVIESSVDGIVSADLHGNILVYNAAASRLFRHEKEEVVGRMNVLDLYPEGVARDVMRKIRAKEFGGRGRLQGYRVDLMTNSGELVPVSLSASLVMDGKRPVGTVGIFTDVREKLAMESQLSRVQRDLQNHEKQSAIAELAGAAAHELNQPLTSVMGYAEYIKRSLSADSALHRPVDVILSETDRMADIVRKVGRITRFETKPYVGNAKIMDLDASSAEEGAESVGRHEESTHDNARSEETISEETWSDERKRPR